MTSDVDVAVVGAGAAGLAAGKRLQEAGVSFRVLEARSRPGGRAWTDTAVFPGIAFDRGGHWLHSASINPLREAADRLGVAYHRQGGWGRQVFDTDGWIGADRIKVWDSAFDEAIGAIIAMGRSGKDVAAIAAIDPNMPYIAAIRHIWTLMSSGEIDQVSALDAARYVDTEENYPVVEGYGALIARVAAGVPVTVDAPVTAIDWSGRGVILETPKGTLRAKAVILTASTNVLAQGGVRFTPELPVAIAEALEAVPIGCAEKVAFRLDRPLDDDVPSNSFTTMMTAGAPALNFYLSPFGQPLAVGFLGGDSGRELTQAGPAAMIDFARTRFTLAFGADVAKRIVAATTTDWVLDPYIRGGYSFARPGKAHLRSRLAEAFSDTIFLAGEATSIDTFSTAHGAHLTGIRAAGRVLAAIGAPV